MYHPKRASRLEAGALTVLVVGCVLLLGLVSLWEWLTQTVKGKVVLATVALITFYSIVGAAASKDPTPFLQEFGRIFVHGVLVAIIALALASMPTEETRFDRWLGRKWAPAKEALLEDWKFLLLVFLGMIGFAASAVAVASYLIGPGDHLPRFIFG